MELSALSRPARKFPYSVPVAPMASRDNVFFEVLFSFFLLSMNQQVSTKLSEVSVSIYYVLFFSI